MAACAPELRLPAEERTLVLELEPPAEPDAVTPVVRLSVAAAIDPAGLRLFRDELSDYHLGRLRAGELPSTLLEREVPTLAYTTAGRATSAPIDVLTPGVYSLASADHGLLGSFAVVPSPTEPVLTRLWPPAGAAAARAIYCGERGLSEPLEVTLEPVAITARLTPGASSDGLFADRCLRLEALEPLPAGTLALPPPRAADVLLEPRPLFGGEPAAAVAPGCSPDEIELGGACASVGDDRLFLRASAPVLVVFREPSPLLVVLEGPGPSHVLQGLPPASELWLSGEAIDGAGRVRDFRAPITTAPAVARVVINEVLANANGSEPAQEWIELVNDGSKAEELGGYRLEDGGGSVTLPERRLEPGEFVVLVSAEYVLDATLDVVPVDDGVLLRLPALGKSGLSNSGEPLRLFDPEGGLVSRFPALKATAAGVSLARRTPASSDDDASAFAAHAAPGASPGAPNALAE